MSVYLLLGFTYMDSMLDLGAMVMPMEKRVVNDGSLGFIALHPPELFWHSQTAPKQLVVVLLHDVRRWLRG